MWLETVLVLEAAAAFWLSAVNCAMLLRLVPLAATRARRVGAVALACVCGAQALEAALFLWLSGAAPPQGWHAPALAAVRGAMLASIAGISVLLLRSRRR